MNQGRNLLVTALGIWAIGRAALAAGEQPRFERTEDVIYGRKFGTALTLDVFAPAGERNGAGVIFAVSGGWFSAHEAIAVGFFEELLRRGYTVFAVVHGSQPRFCIPEVVQDMHRAVRFIRLNAGRFGVDPDRLGIMGGSAGGHLSLMIGTTGGPGDAGAADPVDRESSRVQAVACLFPPTDFLNYGQPGRDFLQALEEELKPFQAPFDFVELDKESGRFVLIADRERRLEIARQISPVTHVTADDPPMLVVHGDADKLVWFQQAEALKQRLDEAGVPNKLVVREGAGHGWPELQKDVKILADWFDTYLRQPAGQGVGQAPPGEAAEPGER